MWSIPDKEVVLYYAKDVDGGHVHDSFCAVEPYLRHCQRVLSEPSASSGDAFAQTAEAVCTFSSLRKCLIVCLGKKQMVGSWQKASTL